MPGLSRFAPIPSSPSSSAAGLRWEPSITNLPSAISSALAPLAASPAARTDLAHNSALALGQARVRAAGNEKSPPSRPQPAVAGLLAPSDTQHPRARHSPGLLALFLWQNAAGTELLHGHGTGSEHSREQGCGSSPNYLGKQGRNLSSEPKVLSASTRDLQTLQVCPVCTAPGTVISSTEWF